MKCVCTSPNCVRTSKDVDKATVARIKLEKQLENLETEMDFMQKVHKEVRRDLPCVISFINNDVFGW